MKQQLIQYVELLFAGAPGSEEIKQEILQNTLDRYDDLTAQGKTPEAAYRLAISGIGDIHEILNQEPSFDSPDSAPFPSRDESSGRTGARSRAVAIAMYILSPVPLFILNEFDLETLGLCFTLILIAAATYVLLMSRKAPGSHVPAAEYAQQPEHTSLILRKKNIRRLLGPICLIVYLLISFLTGAWYITWIIFPVFACVQGLINAIIDLKEDTTYEN